MIDVYSVIEVKIKLDSVPGWGHEAKDHVEWLQKLLDSMVPHYNPQVKLIRVAPVSKGDG